VAVILNKSNHAFIDLKFEVKFWKVIPFSQSYGGAHHNFSGNITPMSISLSFLCICLISPIASCSPGIPGK